MKDMEKTLGLSKEFEKIGPGFERALKCKMGCQSLSEIAEELYFYLWNTTHSTDHFSEEWTGRYAYFWMRAKFLLKVPEGYESKDWISRFVANLKEESVDEDVLEVLKKEELVSLIPGQQFEVCLFKVVEPSGLFPSYAAEKMSEWEEDTRFLGTQGLALFLELFDNDLNFDAVKPLCSLRKPGSYGDDVGESPFFALNGLLKPGIEFRLAYESYVLFFFER